jgi:probable F420-dependent oxidoreductase
MKIGVVFPQTDFGTDVGALRDYTQLVESLGFHHVLAYDHVLGADPSLRSQPDWAYTHEDQFLEIFELFTFMTAISPKLHFATGVLVLPQRETGLVAKQAATLDLLSGGKLRLGVGIGWNKAEFENLGEDFSNRGKRIEEQVTVLRELWEKPLVTFDGKWHQLDRVGINPLPIQQPIPIWFGGGHDNVLRRIAEMGDGWMPPFQEAKDAKPSLLKIEGFTQQVGRNMKDIGIEPRLSLGEGTPENWMTIISDWQEVGANYLSVNTLNLGWTKPVQHMDALKAFAREMPPKSFEI